MSYPGPYPIKLADGGSSAALSASNGGIVYSSASAMGILAGTATAHQLLLSGASTTPLWSTTTFPTSTTASGILYASATNVVGQISVVNNGVLISSAGGVPSFLPNGTAGFVLTAQSGAPPAWAVVPSASISITGDSGGALTSGSFTFTGTGSGLTFAGAVSTFTLGGILNLAHGGTNANLTASNGGIFYSTATAGAILAGTATARQMLQSGASGAPAWSTATYPATTTANQILYSSATNTVSEITGSIDGVLITNHTGVPSLLANSGTAGFVLTANSGAPPSWQLAPSSSVIPVKLISVADTPYTVLAADEFIGVDSSGGAVTVLLPNGPATGKVFIVKDSTGSAVTNNITITTVGGAVNIDGATSFVIATAYQAISLVFDGTAYQIY